MAVFHAKRSTYTESGNVNDLFKNVYKKQTTMQDTRSVSFVSTLGKEKQSGGKGITFSIQVSGSVGTSSKLSVANAHARSIGNFVKYTAEHNKIFTSGSISEELLRLADTAGKTFLVTGISKRLKESKSEHMGEINSLLLSKYGEIGEISSVTLGTGSATTSKITFKDLSSALKCRRIDYPLEIVSTASSNPSVTVCIVDKIADLSADDPSVFVSQKATGTTGTLTRSVLTSALAAANFTVWGEGNYASYNKKLFGLYFWSPDKADRKVDVLGATPKLLRSLNPNFLSGTYHEIDLNTNATTDKNQLYDGLNDLGYKLEIFEAEVDTVIMNPIIYKALNQEQHALDRQKTGEKLKVGDREVPVLMLNGKKVRVILTPLMHTEKVIAYKMDSTFKLLTVGDVAYVPARNGTMLEQRDDETANDIVWDYKIVSYFNMVCHKPRDLAQLRVKNVS